MDRRRAMEDLRLVGAVLEERYEQSVIEYWTFLIWGLLVVTGTLVHAWVRPGTVWMVWGPIAVIGGVTEAAGWMIRSNRRGTPLFSVRNRRLIGGGTGIVGIAVVVLVDRGVAGLSPALVVAFGSLPLFFYAQGGFAELFGEAGLTLGAAFVLLIVGAHAEAWMVAAGLFVGSVYLVAGAHAWRFERLGAPQERGVRRGV